MNCSLVAEVVQQEEDSFQVSHTVTIAQDLQIVFSKFESIQSWWNPSHSFGGDVSKYRFDLEKQALVETLEGGFVRHMDIVYWNPQSRVVLRGGLGPLLTEVVTGILIFDFTETEGVTSVSMKYTVSGKVEQQTLGEWAPAVDFVLTEQLQRLANELADQS